MPVEEGEFNLGRGGVAFKRREVATVSSSFFMTRLSLLSKDPRSSSTSNPTCAKHKKKRYTFSREKLSKRDKIYFELRPLVMYRSMHLRQDFHSLGDLIKSMMRLGHP